MQLENDELFEGFLPQPLFYITEPCEGFYLPSKACQFISIGFEIDSFPLVY